VLHTAVYGVLVVGGVCLVALAGFELVDRLVPAVSRQRHNDVAGFIYAALRVIYAVLLALVVISVWEEYQAASETVEEEANSVAEIFWLTKRRSLRTRWSKKAENWLALVQLACAHVLLNLAVFG
jgi:hypothetical protein